MLNMHLERMSWVMGEFGKMRESGNQEIANHPLSIINDINYGQNRSRIIWLNSLGSLFSSLVSGRTRRRCALSWKIFSILFFCLFLQDLVFVPCSTVFEGSLLSFWLIIYFVWTWFFIKFLAYLKLLYQRRIGQFIYLFSIGRQSRDFAFLPK